MPTKPPSIVKLRESKDIKFTLRDWDLLSEAEEFLTEVKEEENPNPVIPKIKKFKPAKSFPQRQAQLDQETLALLQGESPLALFFSECRQERLAPESLVLYAYLRCLELTQRSSSFILSHQSIEEDIGLSSKHIASALKQLQEKSLIAVHKSAAPESPFRVQMQKNNLKEAFLILNPVTSRP